MMKKQIITSVLVMISLVLYAQTTHITGSFAGITQDDTIIVTDAMSWGNAQFPTKTVRQGGMCRAHSGVLLSRNLHQRDMDSL